MRSDIIIEELWYGDMNDEASLPARAALSTALNRVSGLKPFPIVAQKVLDILTNPDFRLAEVTAALEEDPALAAGMLRVANSAFFSGTRPCSSIAQAFVRMGGMAVTESILAVASMEIFPDLSGVGKKIRDHCASTAALVQTLAKEAAPRFVDGIFICGLMHDVGKLLLMEDDEDFYTAKEALVLTPDGVHEYERKSLGFDHAVFAGHVLASWKFPYPIPQVVAAHHRPESASSEPQIRAMIALLRIADRLDELFRNATSPLTGAVEDLASTADAKFLGISADTLNAMTAKLYAARLDSLRMFGG